MPDYGRRELVPATDRTHNPSILSAAQRIYYECFKQWE